MSKIYISFVILILSCFAAYVLGQKKAELLFLTSRPNEYAVMAHAVSQVVENTTPETAEVTIPDLALFSMFAHDHTWIATLSAQNIRTVLATGDVIPARSVNSGSVARNSFVWPFERIADLLRSADITVINLETPLMQNCIPTVSGMSFCGDARHIGGLTYAGIDVAGVANNHAGNYGIRGIKETEKLLKAAGIGVTGITHEPEVKAIRGIRFAFLSYNDIGSKQEGILWADDTDIKRDIHAAKSGNDIVIVSFHWGIEYQRMPDDRQKFLAHLAIDSGADLVLGNHPHWIQPPELYNGKLIMYAHGNCIFDQEWSEETKLGVLGKYTFYDTRLVDVEFIPIRIRDYGQPYALDGSAGQSVVRMIQESALELSRR